jgi:hypothetical protein
MRKVYVGVTANFDPEGMVTPLSITWEDGHVYWIDRVTKKIRAASLKAGGTGIRYTIEIGGKETFLFYEKPRWFVEGKK